MAIGDAYATAALYKSLIDKSSNADDAEIADDLLAVSRWLDGKLWRFFSKDAAAVARVYEARPDRNGCSPSILNVDDIADTTGLTIKVDEDADGDFSDETAWATTDYELLPLNADKGPETQPWEQIRIPSWSSKGFWPTTQRIQVTAIWGWPAVPKAIERATVQFAAILRLESPRATNRILDFDQVVSTSRVGQTMLTELIAKYSKRRF